MFQRLFLPAFILLCIGLNRTEAQSDCRLILTGKIYCADDQKLIPGAILFIDMASKGTQSDSTGKYVFPELCKGPVRILISSIGYQTLDTTIVINRNQRINFMLKASDIHLHYFEITANYIANQELQTVTKNTLEKKELLELQGLSLGDELKEIPGVNVLKSGATISKPIIHGLHSNRILILNNGVRLEGQQWGSEHAPEVDPFIATRLSVIKGAGSLRYGPDAIGGVVLVEPGALPSEKSIDGELNLVAESNGRAYTGSATLQGAFGKKTQGLSWRIQGTNRTSGSLSTPDYNLDNTGTIQHNYSAAIGYSRNNYGIETYYSRFFTRFGIFSGSHVGGDSTQLIEAFERDAPAVTGDFSYKINRGFQEVDHALWKTNAWYHFKKGGKLTAVFARQTDVRQEFGFNLPFTSNGVDLSNFPEADFQLTTHSTELVYEHKPIENLSGSIGVNFFTQGNVFRGLGYRSLIPNFRNYYGGIFLIEKLSLGKWLIEAGVRYDYRFQREYKLNPITLLKETPEYSFSNYTGNVGFTYKLNRKISLQSNVGKAWRAPSIYELNVDGIHSSTSTYEIGNHNLLPENALNSTASIQFKSDRFDLEIGGYYNYIANYIYLRPSLEYAVTYEGTFRIFRFVQTDAVFKGVDIQWNYRLNNHLSFESKTGLIWANDLEKDDYLTLITPNRFDNRLKYDFDRLGKINHPFIKIGFTAIPEQKRFPVNGDFIPPPKGYVLLNAAIGMQAGKKNPIVISITAENLLNQRYRDYLNFFRYFADEPGRNILLRIHIPFTIIQKTTQKNFNQ